jgi:electron transfer flavoprotein beta subunit
MKAKRKPLETFSIDDLGVSLKSHQNIVKVSPPSQRKAGVMVASVAELVEKLKNEAKVI